MSKLSQDTVNWVHNTAVDEGFLSDWYQASVSSDDEPVWTDEHIHEVCNDFYLIPKESVDGKKD